MVRLPALNASSHLISSHLISSHLISSHLISSRLISSRPPTNEPKQQLNDQRAHAARFCQCSWVSGCVYRSGFRAYCALCVLFVFLVPSAACFFASLLFFLLSSFLQAHQVETQLGQTSLQDSACMNVCRRHRCLRKQRFRPWFRTSCLVCATWVVSRVF